MNTTIGSHKFSILRVVGCLVASVMAFATQFAAAGTWYVNNQIGQDTNTGLTQEMGPEGTGPFRTIAHALKVANSGDTIVLTNTGVDYKECLSICGPKNSGSEGFPFRIVGNGAILSGTVTTSARDWEPVRENVFRFRPENGSFQQLYLGKRPAQFVEVEDKQFDLMPAKSWTLIRGMVYFKTDEGMLPDAYPLSHAYHQTGITLYTVKYVSIENLIVQGFYLDGVNAHDNVGHVQLVGVTSRGNGRSGVSAGGCSKISLNSCLLGDNQRSQLRTESIAKVELAGCSLLENSRGPVIDRQGGEVTETASVAQPAVPESERPIGTGVQPASDDPFAG